MKSKKEKKKMIDAKELRIGNWLKANGIYEGKMVQYDRSVPDEKEGRVLFFEGEYAGEFERDVEPIHLTEEWLVKLGFILSPKHMDEYIEFAYSKTYSPPGIENSEDPDYVVEVVIGREKNQSIRVGLDQEGDQIGLRDVEYVHVFQNVFHALTGQELTINQTSTK